MELPIGELRAIASRELAQAGAKPLFVTISGAHLYGFASLDSDFDVRGAHLQPLPKVLSLSPPRETIELSGEEDGRDIDLVSHEAAKFFRLVLSRNGYVMEQIFSPLVVIGGPHLDELREIAAGCITKGLHHHYRGFYETQVGLHEREPLKKAKTLLYVYRVLLTGIHVLRHGRIESNLLKLVEGGEFVAQVRELMRAKSRERATLTPAQVVPHRECIEKLRAEMDEAWVDSQLPEVPPAAADLDAFLYRLRTNP